MRAPNPADSCVVRRLRQPSSTHERRAEGLGPTVEQAESRLDVLAPATQIMGHAHRGWVAGGNRR